jgi:hypothetical protein
MGDPQSLCKMMVSKAREIQVTENDLVFFSFLMTSLFAFVGETRYDDSGRIHGDCLLHNHLQGQHCGPSHLHRPGKRRKIPVWLLFNVLLNSDFWRKATELILGWQVCLL